MCPFSTNIHFDYDGHILRMEMIMNGFQPMLVSTVESWRELLQ
ncbi:unnamed protein product [Brassica rapa subsp. trilocularis]